MSVTVMRFEGTTFAVLADCHIHPGGGPEFPQALLDALAGADLIVTLGDMGESAGLDQLEAIAPVVGVRGQDDAEDPRTAREALVLTTGDLSFGCVFGPTAVGLATSADPFSPSPDFAKAARRLFGRDITVLLYASTHKPAREEFDHGVAWNPGSAVLPAEGARPTFLRVTAADGAADCEIVTLG